MTGSAVYDARCMCERCVSRTTDTYTLEARCLNCRTSFSVLCRKGDQRPHTVECPACEVRATPGWGGLVVT